MPARSHVRAKRGRVVCASDPRPVRKRNTLAARPGAPSLPVAQVCEALASDLVALAVARADLKAGRTPEETERAIEARVTRARAALAKRGPEGASLNERITAALTIGGGRMLSTAERACVVSRPYARRAAGYLVALVVGGMSAPLALTRAASYALNQALADMLLDAAFAADPRAGVSITKTRGLEDGSKVTNTLPAIGELVKLANAATTTARLELLTALDLDERAGGAQGGPTLSAETLARIEAIRKRNEAAAAEATAHVEAEPTGDEHEHEHEDEEHEATETEEPPQLPPAMTETGARPAPREVVRPPVPEVLRWLPPELRPWSDKFAHLGSIPVPFQRAHAVTQIAGALQIAGTFGRDEARVIGAVQKWRALVIATGTLPTNEDAA